MMNAVGVALCLVRVVVYEKPSPLYALARNENDLQERRDSLGDCAIGADATGRVACLASLERPGSARR